MLTDTTFSIFSLELVIPMHAKQVLVAGLIGYVIGVERAWRGKVASLRTFSTISMGSCIFTILSVQAFGGPNAYSHDITRIAAQIITGIGFLGGGVIFRGKDRVEGVTTGALIWFTAALGMACGFNQISLVGWGLLVATVISMLCRSTHRLIAYGRLVRRVENPVPISDGPP